MMPLDIWDFPGEGHDTNSYLVDSAFEQITSQSEFAFMKILKGPH